MPVTLYTKEKTEAQRGQITYLGSHSKSAVEQAGPRSQEHYFFFFSLVQRLNAPLKVGKNLKNIRIVLAEFLITEEKEELTQSVHKVDTQNK